MGKLQTLRTLRLSPNVRDMNLPHLLQDNSLLEFLHIDVWDKDHSNTLNQALNGPMPFKLRDIRVSGRAVKNLPNNFLQVSVAEVRDSGFESLF